jgi:hypothetical protein
VPAAKLANPRARFLLAGCGCGFQDHGTWTTQSWDTLLLNSPDGSRAVSAADGVTSHPYGPYTTTQGWRGAIQIHNDFPTQPVWITEIGYRIGDTVDSTPVSESVQASWMRRDLADFASWRWAQAFVWFKWADYGPDNMWGVVRPDGSHRPSYDAYKAFSKAS